MTWQPNQWQAAALRVYGDGDYAYIVDGTDDHYDDGLEGDGSLLSAGEPARTWTDAGEFDEWCTENLGDTLLLFIMRELGDDVDGPEAVRMMERAIEDIEAVLVPLKLLA